jgi:hypothetical protein
MRSITISSPAISITEPVTTKVTKITKNSQDDDCLVLKAFPDVEISLDGRKASDLKIVKGSELTVAPAQNTFTLTLKEEEKKVMKTNKEVNRSSPASFRDKHPLEQFV